MTRLILMSDSINPDVVDAVTRAQAWINAANAQNAQDIPDYPIVYWTSKMVAQFPGEQLFDNPDDDPEICQLKKINNSPPP